MRKKGKRALKLFLQICQVSLILLLLLILAGGVVRSSGSGMGCPDWPKCFNRIIPPTKLVELPAGYETNFLNQRMKKNQHLSKVLASLGFHELANKISSDPNIGRAEPFNAFKTWVEYINRLIGMLTGFAFLALWLNSLFLWNSFSKLFWFSSLNLILVFMQAYLGALVVSTNLLSGLISLHMLLSLVILYNLIWIYRRAYMLEKMDFELPMKIKEKSIFNLIGFATLMSLVQILLGTHVREMVDAYQVNLSNPALKDAVTFFHVTGKTLNLHQMVSLLVLSINVYIFFMIRRRTPLLFHLRKSYIFILVIIFLQMVLGISLELVPLPPVSQALHVFFAVLLFAAQIWSLFELEYNPSDTFDQGLKLEESSPKLKNSN